MVIIFVGRKGVGKTTFARVIAQKTGMELLSATSIIDNQIKLNKLLNTQENRIMVSRNLQRKTNSGSIFETIYRKHQIGTIVDSAVYKADLEYFESQENGNVFKICISSDDKIRLSKIMNRNRPGDPISEEAVIELENKYMYDFDISSIAFDYYIINNYDMKLIDEESCKIITILKERM